MIKIGTDVYSTDGLYGKLAKVVVDSDSETITHLIVEKGLLNKVSHVIPMTAVAEINSERIQLSLETAELDASAGEFQEERFQAVELSTEATDVVVDPASMLRWGVHYAPPLTPHADADVTLKRGVDASQSVIGKGTPVYDRDGYAGEIGEMQVDNETGQITHMVVKSGLFARNLVVPMKLVSGVSDQGVTVDAHRDELEGSS